MENTLPRLWTAQDVAIWLSCPPRQVIRWAKAGKLPCITLPDGDVMFDPAVLAAWLTTRRAQGDDHAAE
jgi:hypothetical protein